MKRAWIPVLLAFAAPILAQDTPAQEEDAVDRVLRRVEGVVNEELQRLRTELRALIRRELGVESAAPEEGLQGALDSINAAWLEETLTWIASDERAGRRAGSDGEAEATEFIAERYAEWGLEPVGDDDTYFQHFTVGRNTSMNTVGLLRGSELPDEILIIGGHHDHLGQGRSFGALAPPTEGDDIYNGADDNGSGTTTVLSVARAFHESGLRPRRSILFMTFGAEEMGLVGSRYYVNHPIFPLENTVAMINLDMVGRNADRPVGLYGVGTADIFEEVAQSAVQATGLNARLVEGTSIGFGDSDHSSFRSEGVSVMFFFTGLHNQYHRVQDHSDLIEYDNMALIGRTALLILWDLSERDARPSAATPSTPGPSNRVLGITTAIPSDETLEEFGIPDGEGAVQVETVSRGSVAERIGLQAGDWIVSIGGSRLPRGEDALATLREGIADAGADTDVEIEIVRDSRRLRLTARWDR